MLTSIKTMGSSGIRVVLRRTPVPSFLEGRNATPVKSCHTRAGRQQAGSQASRIPTPSFPRSPTLVIPAKAVECRPDLLSLAFHPTLPTRKPEDPYRAGSTSARYQYGREVRDLVSQLLSPGCERNIKFLNDICFEFPVFF